MGPFSVSRRHISLGTLSNMLLRRMYSISSRLALAHSSGWNHPPFLPSQCQPFPQTEQSLLVIVHELHHLVVRAANSLVLPVLMDDTANPLCILCLPFLLRSSSFNCSSIAWATWRTHALVCSVSLLALLASARACRYVFALFLCIRIAPNQTEHAQVCCYCYRSWHVRSNDHVPLAHRTAHTFNPPFRSCQTQ